MRLLITGSRTWESQETIGNAILATLDDWALPPQDVILVSGNCPIGADYMAEQAAYKLGMEVELHPADWNKHGKRAGFVRNAEMVDLGADRLLAFIRDESKGATMTLNLATKAGISADIYRESSDGNL